jgi:hypothetical protein
LGIKKPAKPLFKKDSAKRVSRALAAFITRPQADTQIGAKN